MFEKYLQNHVVLNIIKTLFHVTLILFYVQHLLIHLGIFSLSCAWYWRYNTRRNVSWTMSVCNWWVYLRIRWCFKTWCLHNSSISPSNSETSSPANLYSSYNFSFQMFIVTFLMTFLFNWKKIILFLLKAYDKKKKETHKRFHYFESSLKMIFVKLFLFWRSLNKLQVAFFRFLKF